MSGGQFPGLYAQSPKITVVAGTSYSLRLFSRCDGQGLVAAIAYNSSNAVTGHFTLGLPLDAGSFTQSTLDFTAPASTSYVRVRFRVQSNNTTADIDLIKLGRER
jgi:hypothetical protein